MTCAEVQAQLSLYLYGELDFSNEEIVENHIDECAFCQLSLNREKEWHSAVNRHQQDVSPEWMAACRAGLHERVAGEPATGAHVRHIGADWIRGLLDFRLTERSYRLAGVSCLLIIGFGAGRMMNSFGVPAVLDGERGAGDLAGFVRPSLTRVQAIRPESGNRVRIVLQQVQVREVFGSRNDDKVRTLLVGAAQDSTDPGVRMDSVEMLAGQSGQEIRNAIVRAIKSDPNAAVRIKAVESLRQFPGDPVTREALEFALARDRDPGVRTEAIDVLAAAGQDLPMTPQLVETISNVMHSAQDDEYLRFRCAEILNARPVSNGVY